MNRASRVGRSTTSAKPDLGAAERWLRAVDDPIVRLLVATYLEGTADDHPDLLEAALQTPVMVSALESQRRDGSWGEDDRVGQRVLPTLWMTKTLAELGLGPTEAWNRAANYLADVAHTDRGVFALDGTTGGVLSCYVGIAASTYLLGGRPELAEPQIRWVRDHQQVKRGGQDLRAAPAEHFSDHLAVRYGGCMRDTTCLVGLVKTGLALRCWLATGADDHVQELLAAIREAFLARRLWQAADGSVVPLAVTPKRAESWLESTYPLDWRSDLVEVFDLAASGGMDPRLQPALDLLAATQLEDGSWPLRRTFRPEAMPALERRSTTRGSPVVTLRVLCALRALA